MGRSRDRLADLGRLFWCVVGAVHRGVLRLQILPRGRKEELSANPLLSPPVQPQHLEGHFRTGVAPCASSLRRHLLRHHWSGLSTRLPRRGRGED